MKGALAISNDLDIDSITRTIHAHPTLSEAFMEAVHGLEGQAIHIAPPRKRSKRKGSRLFKYSIINSEWIVLYTVYSLIF